MSAQRVRYPLRVRSRVKNAKGTFKRISASATRHALRFIVFVVLLLAHILQTPHHSSQFDSYSWKHKQWVAKRTIRFTRSWPNHKWRNVAIYTCLSTRNVPFFKSLVYNLLVCPDIFYERRHDELFQVPTICIRHSCLKRYGRSHYIYAEFVLKTYDQVVNTDIKPLTPTDDGKIAVIVEPRLHPLLEFSIRQVMMTLGSEWSLQLFLSTENKKWVEERFQIYDGGSGRNIVVTSLSKFGLDRMALNGNRIQSAFSAHEQLYKAIQSEHILWFQIDVVLRFAPQQDWLHFAYVGSEWHGCEYPFCSAKTCDKVCGGGNSGLSLRRRSRLLMVATKGELPEDLWGQNPYRPNNRGNRLSGDEEYFENDDLRNNSVTKWFEDDLQLSAKLALLGLLPPGDVPRQFAISQALPKSESILRVNPTGMHKPWDTPWIHPFVIEWLLAHPFEQLKHSSK